MQTIRILSSIAAVAMFVSGDASAGYIRDWLDARGGCAAYRSLNLPLGLMPVNRPFLDRLAEDWTDEMLVEISQVYAVCASEAQTPVGIPREQRFISGPAREGGLKIARRLRDEFVEPARVRQRDAQAAIVAQRKLAEDRGREDAERIERDRRTQAAAAQEEARQDAERAAKLKREADAAIELRSARIAQAQDHARRERELADELAKVAEAEEKHLAELKRVNDEARAVRLQAEKRLADVRAAAEIERRHAEEERAVQAPGKPSEASSAPEIPLPLSEPPKPMAAAPPALVGSAMSLDDFRLDFDRLKGRRVTLTGTLMLQGDMLMLMPGLVSGIVNTDMIFVEWEKLPRDTRQRVMQACRSVGCRATVEGKAADVLLNKGVIASDIRIE